MTQSRCKAILTGHSRGLGAAIAARLRAAGVEVLAISRAQNSDLQAADGPPIRQLALDLADLTALARWLATDELKAFLADSTRALLINNAGVVTPIGPLAMQTEQAIAQAIAVNISAPMMLSAAFVRQAPVSADRRLLHVSSGAGRNAVAGWSVYGATKAALDHHARGIAADGDRGLRVCSLAPGVIDTDMQGQIRASTLEQFPQRARFDNLKQDGGLATPHDCARRLVAHLLSDSFGRQVVADLRELGG